MLTDRDRAAVAFVGIKRFLDDSDALPMDLGALREHLADELRKHGPMPDAPSSAGVLLAALAWIDSLILERSVPPDA